MTEKSQKNRNIPAKLRFHQLLSIIDYPNLDDINAKPKHSDPHGRIDIQPFFWIFMYMNEIF